MELCPILILLSSLLYVDCASYNAKDLRCLVCMKTVEEMDNEISKISPTKKINIGGYKIDKDGNLQQKTVPLQKSEVQISEIMDSICKKMDDYARGVHKTTKQLMLLKFITDDGKMNEEISNVDLIQDTDLNQSLKFYCEGIVDEFNDEFLEVFQNEEEELDVKICGDLAKLCVFEDSVSKNDEL